MATHKHLLQSANKMYIIENIYKKLYLVQNMKKYKFNAEKLVSCFLIDSPIVVFLLFKFFCSKECSIHCHKFVA